MGGGGASPGRPRVVPGSSDGLVRDGSDGASPALCCENVTGGPGTVERVCERDSHHCERSRGAMPAFRETTRPVSSGGGAALAVGG